MDEFSRQLWKELNPADEDIPIPVPSANARAEKPLDHYTSPVLLERAAYLRKLAKLGDGLASETVKAYPQHRTLLTVRTRSSEVEVHEDSAYLLIVLEGRATLITSAAAADAKADSSGKIRGSSLAEGNRQELRAGDLVHITTGTPHQVLLAGDKSIAYFAVEIRESDEAF